MSKPPATKAPRRRESQSKPNRQSAKWIVLALALLAGVAGSMAVAQWSSQSADQPAETTPAIDAPVQRVAQRTATTRRTPPVNPLNAERAYGYLTDICRIGPRISGSVGMRKQQELLREHYEQLGGKVTLQRFQARDPLGGANVPMANLIVEWHPERKKRILLCAHYDTRPLPDQDPDPVRRQQGVFIGANDGGSGTALLMELAHQMAEFDSEYGVDFVLFDGEELVYTENRDPYFLGSTWFAQQYVQEPPAHEYEWGILFDMVGDADLQIYQERRSVAWRDTRPLVNQIWATARRLGVNEFIPRAKYDIRDDHVPLRNIAKIPTCDIIDFDYPAWHTEADSLRNCSGESLAKVGWVVYEWLQSLQ
jgi:hypothetical protein